MNCGLQSCETKLEREGRDFFPPLGNRDPELLHLDGAHWQGRAGQAALGSQRPEIEMGKDKRTGGQAEDTEHRDSAQMEGLWRTAELPLAGLLPMVLGCSPARAGFGTAVAHPEAGSPPPGSTAMNAGIQRLPSAAKEL